ncbi:hypothetical protein AOLI_G00020730 [Acnodon oligacanthus]
MEREAWGRSGRAGGMQRGHRGELERSEQGKERERGERVRLGINDPQSVLMEDVSAVNGKPAVSVCLTCARLETTSYGRTSTGRSARTREEQKIRPTLRYSGMDSFTEQNRHFLRDRYHVHER